MKRMILVLAIPFALVLASGCLHVPASGYLFTWKKVPLDLNLSRTPTSQVICRSEIKHCQYYVDIKWNTNAIGDIAKRNGIETVYFADMETLSILGIWNQYTVYVYGK